MATNTNTKTKPKTDETFVFKTNRGNKYTVPIKYKDCTSVSQIIRAMTADGASKSEIHKVTGILYQHVRNVLMQPVKTS